MNIGQLEYVVETIKRGSFASASKTLYVTPEAISKSIGFLERELDVKLFVRKGRGISPTEFAMAFAEQAQEILNIVADIKIHAMGNSLNEEPEGTVALAVATTHHRGSYFSHSDFEGFKERHPKVDLELQFFSSETCLLALQENIVNAAIILGRCDYEGFESHKLFTYRPWIAVSKTNDIATLPSVSLGDVAKTPIAMPLDLRCEYRRLTEIFSNESIKPNIAEIPPLLESHLSFLQQGGAILVARNSRFANCDSNVVLLPFEDKVEIDLPLFLVHKQLDSNSPIPCLLSYLKSITKQVSKRLRGCR